MYQYLLFHKPYGVLPQFTDGSPEPRPTLAEYINIPEIYPVGRLDLDSEGLLFLTGDNWVKHRMLDPEHNHPRIYHVQLEGEITDEALGHLRRGVAVADYISRPVKTKRVSPTYPPRVPAIRFRAEIPTSWIEITMTEGKNRQVRRMTAAVGFPTLRLIRVGIGELTLQGLAPGQYRHLTATETVELRVGFQRKR